MHVCICIFIYIHTCLYIYIKCEFIYVLHATSNIFIFYIVSIYTYIDIMNV